MSAARKKDFDSSDNPALEYLTPQENDETVKPTTENSQETTASTDEQTQTASTSESTHISVTDAKPKAPRRGSEGTPQKVVLRRGKKSKQITFLLRPEDHELIKRAAASAGVSMNEWANAVLHNAAIDELEANNNGE